MNLDQWGLPATRMPDGSMDSNDTLQRCGMILTGVTLSTGVIKLVNPLVLNQMHVSLETKLQPKPGVYARYPGASPANCSADQILSALAYWIASGNTKQSLFILAKTLLRMGFAQNYRDGLDASKAQKIKLPDFMLVRALPLFLRIHPLLYPLTIIFDALLLLAALSQVGPVWRDGSGFTRKTPDDVDDNLIVMTLAVCRARMLTPFSWLAAKLYARLRSVNLGNTELGEKNPVQGALAWYHRAPAGNPEIAELWKPIVDKYLS